MKNRVLVHVASREYALLSDEDEAYVYKIAGMIDKEIAQMSESLALTDAAILACFNIADRLQKAEDNAEHLREQVRGHLDELQKTKGELAEARRENTRMKTLSR